MENGKTRSETGKLVEDYASNYLNQRGLRQIERNYRCRGGEIDLIMRDGKTLVFVEVRYRKHHSFGGAAASVDWRKQQRLVLAAQHYLQRQSVNDLPCRFDVVAVSPGTSGDFSVQWIKNAIETS